VKPENASGQATATSLAVAGQRFVARQPILDRAQKLIGYELLFRNGIEDFFTADPELAARATLDSSLLFGLETLCRHSRAFVNCTRDILLKDLVTLLPPDQTVVEILETVEPEDRVVAACQRLKKSGYMIALDDFEPDDKRVPLCPYADIIKVDVRATNPDQQARILSSFGSSHCKLLAEKVETHGEFESTRKMGYSYFQGYFLFKPELIVGREVPASRLRQLRLLEMVSRPELDLRELEKALKLEASICYRLLRYLNSPIFGFALEIKSVRHAMAILGERELRRWTRMVVALGMAEQRCSELIIVGLTRARFCELLSEHLRSSHDLFLMGLLSTMDAILEIEMDALLEQLPIDHVLKDTLLSRETSLRPLYRLLLAHESGEWAEASTLAQQLGLTDERVADTWWQALTWAQEAAANA
jgi:EAL and modified HD-GYP domain-containing signal transduction protein